MKASELRIGNYVDEFGHGPLQVTAIFDDDDGGDIKTDSEMYLPICNYSPIPLTSEWLERFGFEFQPSGEEVYEQTWRHTDPRFELWEHSEGFCHEYYGDGEINTVHQLQNLYFALTGEELTIKDDGKKEGKEEKADREVDRRNMGS